MFIAENGKLIEGSPSVEQEELMMTRYEFLKNPLPGVQQMIDFAEQQKDEYKEKIKAKFEETLLIKKYPEDVRLRLYDNTRQRLYDYYKTNLK